MNSMLLPIHIAAGGLAIMLGALALSVRKGGTTHRRSGLLFVYAMLVMGITASILGLLKGPNDPNVTAGITVAYFVGTALMTVRPASRWSLPRCSPGCGGSAALARCQWSSGTMRCRSSFPRRERE
jgi:hypothetical protein